MELQKLEKQSITVSPALIGVLVAMTVQFASGIWWAAVQTERTDTIKATGSQTQDQIGNVSTKIDSLMHNTTGMVTRMETVVQTMNDHEARIRALERAESRNEIRLDAARSATIVVPAAASQLAPLPQSDLQQPRRVIK